MKNFKTSNEGIVYLLNLATTDDWTLIEQSLNIAKNNARLSLDQVLFESLYWPTDRYSYINYLNAFVKWIPQQSGEAAWRKPNTLHSQEVYDRLCHYYYLVDQQTSSGTLAQNIPWFSEFLVDYANYWGDFLNTPESFNETILNSFIKFSPQYRIQDSMVNGKPNAPWNSFNDFFARELNPGLRPITSPDDNSIVTMPADCTFRKKYAINQSSYIDEIVIKQTHRVANINELLKGSQFANSFANGTFVHYFLGPYSYHRFHVPVSGVVKECFPVQGLTFLEVNISKGQFDAPDNAENGYQFLQARGIITIDTTGSTEGDMGIVAIIPIGMCQVSSVHMTAIPGSTVSKGDEFGFFKFGGSDIILLFQEGKSPFINECSNYRHYGNSISTCPPVYPT
ncbi:phosphatidylserine decarboxylase [Flaviramulus sp. BrNp1-15]|uniref:phosphatidylserine decarboxylase n=1 Tax=Flaviramulus sp. BrNp1-15 TaxID=2916754 RepID=UPI001EE8BA91|nr:phosphatidylserine decarboxylase [Flaviramulus sp. BrNp1-15]ULC60823.1 phosphatidylserine decarboxylase [Flaviramulus sp. BrNp1-15]